MPERASASNRDEFFNELGTDAFLYTKIKEYITDKTVLDIACGAGMGTKLISESAKKVVGVDVSKQVIQENQRKHGSENCSFVAGNMCRIPFDDASFDTVVSFESIEHIDDTKKEPEQFLSEVHRVLRPGGYFILSTPNNGEEKRIQTYFSRHEFHKFEYSKKELEETLQKQFTILSFMGKNRKGIPFDPATKAKRIPEWKLYVSYQLVPKISGILPLPVKKIYRKTFKTSSHLGEFFITHNEEGLRTCHNFFVIMRKK